MDLSATDFEDIEAADIATGLRPAPMTRSTRIESIAPPTVIVPVQFESGSSVILPSGLGVLKKVATAIGSDEFESFKFLINVHPEDGRSEPDDPGLHGERAAAVNAALMAFGVSDRVRIENRVGRDSTTTATSSAGRPGASRIEIVNLGESP